MSTAVDEAVLAVRTATLPEVAAFGGPDWPIVASMGHVQPQFPTGYRARDAGPSLWEAEFRAIAGEGFDRVEVSDAWLPLWRLDAGEIALLRGAADASGLAVDAVLAARCSVAERGKEKENVGRVHATIDAAAALGAAVVGLGFHEELTPAQRAALWFWTEPDALSPSDDATRDRAVGHLRELADHAAQVGVRLSLELYPNEYLGTADGAVRLVEQVGRDNVGLNPDLANIFRVQGEVEPWEYVAARTLPYANYWHVKNCHRFVDPGRGVVLTGPAPLADGVIDYRRAVAYALRQGFAAPILVEHYGGDGLTAIARGRDHLRSILPAATP